jgi:hypothetical protein
MVPWNAAADTLRISALEGPKYRLHLNNTNNWVLDCTTHRINVTKFSLLTTFKNNVILHSVNKRGNTQTTFLVTERQSSRYTHLKLSYKRFINQKLHKRETRKFPSLCRRLTKPSIWLCRLEILKLHCLGSAQTREQVDLFMFMAVKCRSVCVLGTRRLVT